MRFYVVTILQPKGAIKVKCSDVIHEFRSMNEYEWYNSHIV